MEKEREIYIRELLLYICQKWKRILMWMILFAVLMGGVGAVKSYKEMTVARQEQNEGDDGLSAYKAKLSEKAIEEVDKIFDLYLSYNKSLDSSLKYYNNSFRMKINPNSVPTIFMQYRINNTKKIKDIITAYSNMVLEEDSCERIKKDLGIEIDASYIGELVEFDMDGIYDQGKLGEEKIVEEDMSSSMLVQIIAPSQQMCEAIADEVQNEIQAKEVLLKNKIGSFDLVEIGRSYMDRADRELLNEQQNYISQINVLYKNIDGLATALDVDQQEYFSGLINQEGGEINQSEKANFNIINLKYIVIGVILGFLFSSFGYIAVYVLNDKLKTEKELEDYYDISVLENIDTFRNKKNKYLINLSKGTDTRSEDDKVEMVYENIKAYMEMKDITNIHFTSTLDSNEVEELMDKIVKRFRSDNYKMTLGSSVMVNAESLKSLVEAQGVVLVEQIGKSKFKEIGREIDICRRNQKDIIGSVVIS